MNELDFVVDGTAYTHTDRKWIVCTNRHPNTDGTPWGWIEGAPGNVTWSGSSKHAHAVVDAHNAWIDAQEAPALKLARLTPQLQRLGKERADLMARVQAIVSEEEAVAEQIRTIRGDR